jgi:hypothetical protein
MEELFEIMLGEIEEKQEKDYVTLKFPFMRADALNLNGRIYPRKVVEKVVKETQAKLRSGESIYGGPAHPQGSLELDAVSHRLLAVEMVGDKAYATAQVLPTTKGSNLMVILRHGGSLGVSSRGFGTVAKEKKDGKDVEVVQDDYILNGCDFVTAPSFEMYAGQQNMIESLQEELREGLRGNTFLSQPLLNEEKILEQQYRVAQITGYKLSFEDFKASKTEKGLVERFDFAVRAGFRGSLADYRKIGRK